MYILPYILIPALLAAGMALSATMSLASEPKAESYIVTR